MITFVPNTIEKIQIEMDIMNSNQEYNSISKAKKIVEESDILEEYHESEELNVIRLLIKNNEKYIGLVDYCLNNSADERTWISLFAIHKNDQGSGIAKKVYHEFEKIIRDKKKDSIRLAVHKNNKQGIYFWNSVGFVKYKELEYNGKPHFCLEKEITD
ncbi:GNAT family N-acetyltransferase [Aquibacillus koreensis]|uniref:GNAT family N-acetyltransferase n=1 Tax=Aquibacillus koreensis TaxID=279446 RepID=A0A9X3WGK8_9BACI|nr:GNAT family N-acetyltransferase [Aquibacillus koreensis]MCT2536423.1 GNAT family N-acetyltransferase [Aquibacillus koreensis]MDC3419487.1 GNAT family N-acetyltransferase [Aquibacillus koreensis]